jgi:hypothetical protein
MHTCRISMIALSVALLGVLAVLAFGSAGAWFTLTLGTALVALAASAVLLAGVAYVRDLIRAARWNAGHRLR